MLIEWGFKREDASKRIQSLKSYSDAMANKKLSVESPLGGSLIAFVRSSEGYFLEGYRSKSAIKLLKETSLRPWVVIISRNEYNTLPLPLIMNRHGIYKKADDFEDIILIDFGKIKNKVNNLLDQ